MALRIVSGKKRQTGVSFRFLLLGLAAALITGLFVGACLTDIKALSSFTPLSVPTDAAPEFRLMAEAWTTIRKVYVDRSAIKPNTMGYGAISGMVDALGDTGHSTFLSPDMLKEQHNFTEGRLKGVGLEIRMKAGQVVIVAPLDGSPAQAAGLRPGEVILKVDGREIGGLSLIEVVKLISGPPGSPISVVVLNPQNGRTRRVDLTRASIVIHNVTWHRLPASELAHVRISGFSQGVTKDLKKALTEIGEENLAGLILDLRSNPGGLLDEAIGTASQFLKTGNVLITRDAAGRETPVPVRGDGIAFDVPMVALVNQGTASAAEILAGALQDAHRAPLVGEKTFGTGTVLQEFALSDGSALLLATEEWLRPNGKAIWHKGIVPNVEVPLPDEVFPLLPETEKGLTMAEVKASGDAQLLKAVEMLREGRVRDR